MIDAKVSFDLDTIEIKRCLKNPTIMGYLRGMTNQPFSGMNIMLNEFRDGKYALDARAIIASIEGKPIGWALFTTDRDDRNDIIFDQEAETYLQIFVRNEYRKQGIGSTLFLKGQELAAGRSIGVSKHNREAIIFFEKLIPKEVLL